MYVKYIRFDYKISTLIIYSKQKKEFSIWLKNKFEYKRK